MLIAACGGAWGDGAWGPRVDLSCRPFDFTLFFQDVIFSCIPNAVFLLLAPAGIWHRWRQPVVQGQALWLYRCKLAVLTALLVSQAVFLALRVSTNHGTMNTNASLAGDVLGLLAIAAAIPLSYLHHFRSIRPSTVLALYFSALSLLNIARLRTLWQLTAARSNGISAVFTIIFILMLAALGFESKSQNGPSHAAKSNTPEPFSGFWKRLSYAWLARTFRRGYSAVLSVESLPELDPQIESRKLHLQLEHVWSNCKKGRRHALLYSCLRAYLAPFLSAVIPRVCLTCFTFSQPFLIETTIEYIGQPSAEADYGKALIGAYALVFVGIAASTAFYWYQTFRLVVSIRGSLISLIHQRSLGTRAIDLGESTAITLMGTDTERIVTGFRSIHELWGSFLDIVVAMYLLERQLGVACLVPLAIILVFAGVTGRLSGKSNNAQRSWIEKIQARLRLASSMLGDMKAVKTLGLSDKMFSILQAMRLVEIRTSEKFRKLLIWQLLLSNAPALLAPVATFALYAGISLVRHDSSLLAAKAFTSLTLISLLTTPVLELLQSIPAVIQCIGCFDRIQDYCSKPSSAEELKVDNDVSSPNSLSSDLAFELVDNVDVTVISISIQGKSFGWSHDDPPVLKDIDLVINFGKIVMAIGPVGSGKTTLLESILGETLSMPEGSTNASNNLSDRLEIAYCSQSPWLRDTTIQQNIIGCDEMDPKWYATVLWACELNADLEQLPRGDLTIVGSNGAGLSGGQKQRITLARAFYCRRRIILLDDIFSGIDANTTSLIVRRLFGTAGLARQSRTTVLLATHNLKLLPYADEIVVLEDGRLTAGDISNVQKYATTEEKYEDGPHHASTRVDMLAESEDPERAIDVSVIADPSLNSIGDPLTNSTDEVIQSSKRQSGDWQIYKYYANASGYHYVLVFLIGQALGSFFRDFPTIWLLWWSNANAQNPGPRTDGLYLSVYAVLTLAGLASLLLGCWALIIKMVSNSAANLHSNLLKSVLGAPLYFFQTVDTGSLTNRFSQDMELIDMSLPMYAINYVFNAFNLVVKAIILLIFARYLGVALPFVVAIVYVTQNFYLRTSRQIRLLDIEAKAPLYNHFIEVVAGSSTIRAMGSAWKDSFQQEVYARIDFSQRPFYLLLCIQQCLALVLDLTVAILAILVVAIIVTWRDAFQEGDVGVALSMLITFSSTLMSVVKFWTLMEMSVGAVARVRDFVAETDSEEPEDRVAHGQEASRRSLTPPADWPQAGAIDFEGVIAAYSPLAPPVLKSISLSIKPGEKIAICGRSGSGKTSLMLSLLQITDVRGGSIKIDGIDILSSDIRRTELRSRLNVINQDPFLMPGTVRFNMDPFGLSNDETIVAALKKVRLWDLIADDGGVEREMNSEALSAGQRQLFCLARAMVRQGKILVLDEATSNVDNETESIMYNAIASEFVGVTVLSVVHRLPHIGFYDRVCIFEKGKVADIGTSEELAERSSIFSDLLKFGGDAAIPE